MKAKTTKKTEESFSVNGEELLKKIKELIREEKQLWAPWRHY